MNFCMV